MTETTVIFTVPRGTAYITAQQLVIYVSSFVYYVLLIRILNLSQIGEVSLLAAASAAFTTITQLAIPLATTRFISSSIGGKDPSATGSVARTSLRLTITIAAPTLLLSVLASPWIASTVFKSSNATSFLVVAFASSFLLDFTALYGAYFLGLGRYAEMTYQNVLYHPLSRGFGLVLAYKGLGAPRGTSRLGFRSVRRPPTINLPSEKASFRKPTVSLPKHYSLLASHYSPQPSSPSSRAGETSHSSKRF